MNYERLLHRLRRNIEKYDKMGQLDRIHSVIDKVYPLAMKQRENSNSFKEYKREKDERLYFRTL